MSFGTHARKVRDPALPYGRRISALARCVQLYRPLGYRATFAYLAEVAGPFRHDETALLRALEALSTSRNLWQASLRGYADRRRAAKRLGRRRPGAAEVDPNPPAWWYGDVRRAALCTIGFLLRERDPIARADVEVVRLASAVLENHGAISAFEEQQLAALRHRFEALRKASAWPTVDLHDLHTALESLWVLRQIANATAGCAP
ncbi:hypothetical protein [Krasilnikovia sp. MM14-A1004]|uniref:hypothetical protein n=1 Tax=Krasilnikovia sp. MM14-A1004 TaxID=3373541 RepID=UPI00399C8A65